ncbi:hypothetical protein B0H13DRAFT_1592634, partial [Mycena leptocephala]
ASDRSGHPHLDSVKFRNVSVITALNVHKDTIYDLGARRFVEGTGQELHGFYMIDRLSPKVVDTHKWEALHTSQLEKNKSGTSGTVMGCRTFIPGCLRLCIGMLVMIKSNDATELCITKGQEAIMKGWDKIRGPRGKRVLETLFMEAHKPPHPIQIRDLPPKVVPLPRTASKITALLEDDSLLSISRDQVLVLQNFAMIDTAFSRQLAQAPPRPSWPTACG